MLASSYTFIETPCDCCKLVCGLCCESCGCRCCGTIVKTRHQFLIHENVTETTTDSSRGGALVKGNKRQCGKVDKVLQTPYCCCIEFWCCDRFYNDLHVDGFESKATIPCLNCACCQRYPVESRNQDIGTIWKKYRAVFCCPYLILEDKNETDQCNFCCNLGCFCNICQDRVYYVKNPSGETQSEIIHKGCSICQHEIIAGLPQTSEQYKLLILSAVNFTWF